MKQRSVDSRPSWAKVQDVVALPSKSRYKESQSAFLQKQLDIAVITDYIRKE